MFGTTALSIICVYMCVYVCCIYIYIVLCVYIAKLLLSCVYNEYVYVYSGRKNGRSFGGDVACIFFGREEKKKKSSKKKCY